MARDEQEAVATQAAETPTSTEQAPEATVTTEAPQAGTEAGTETGTETKPAEAPAQPEGPSAEEIAKAVSDFEALATQVVETRDQETGELAEAEVTKVKTAYAALPVTKAKTQVRKWLDEAMKASLAKERNPSKARAFLTLGEEVKLAVSSRETIAKPPIDPIQAYIDRATTTYLSTSFIDQPADLPADWTTKLQEKANSLRGEIDGYKTYLTAHDAWAAQPAESRGEEPKAPEVSEIVVNAAKIARGRSVGVTTRRKSGEAKSTSAAPSYSGPRRNIKAHIAEAFAGVAVGTFVKTGAVAKFKSSEYPDGNASSGAVQASFDSARFDVAGVQPTEQGGIKGAIKTA